MIKISGRKTVFCVLLKQACRGIAAIYRSNVFMYLATKKLDVKIRLCVLVMLICVRGIVLNAQDKTSFQIAYKWLPDYDVRSDVAILYGMDSTFISRYKSWKDEGYQIQFMTGIAWGNYQNYFTGKFDGHRHFDDAQVDVKGDTIWHNKDVPYVNPSESYLTYIKSLVKKAIDTGVASIYLEEPEYWAAAGYGDSFKRAWLSYYGFPWVAQHLSPEATYLSSKLKYQLYYNALNEVFSYAKSYAKTKGIALKCFVPTHSLLNYAAWQIVSPEANLASLSAVDGYIAQVWTGTSRVPVYYNGLMKERTFENAFLEYGTIYSMVESTKRTVYFLTDPIEDGIRSWNDYKRNYQATFTAQLLYPKVNKYEVMPWPNRIYLGKFPVEGKDSMQAISPAFATQMQVMVNCLNDMPMSENKVNGTLGIGILLANSIMFQRFPVHEGYDDPQLSNFYGMALPLLKRGIPVEMVHFENLGIAESLKKIKVLVMSYSNMKPLTSKGHNYLANWVRKGGVIIYVGRDDDPFQTVQEWWNTKGNNYKAPSEHLFEIMGINVNSNQSEYRYGKGCVYLLRKNPKELLMQKAQDDTFVNMVKKGYERAGINDWHTKNFFYLERGPYTIVSAMTENKDTASVVINRPVIDLFNPELPVLNKKEVHPGEQAFLYDLQRVKDQKKPAVLCAAARIYKEERLGMSYSFTAKGPTNTKNAMRIFLPIKPLQIKVSSSIENKAAVFESEWDENSHTLLLQFQNRSEGIDVKLNW